MNVLAALGDAPTAAIAVVAILLGIVVVARGQRGRPADEEAGPSLLTGVPVAAPAGGDADDDGLETMAPHDVGHGTIRLRGVASPDTEPEVEPEPAPEPAPTSWTEPSPEPTSWTAPVVPATPAAPEPAPEPPAAPEPQPPPAAGPPPPYAPPPPGPAPPASPIPFRQGKIRFRKPPP